MERMMEASRIHNPPMIPDEEGIWDEDEEVIWLPRVHYPKRIQAISWAMKEWGVTLPEIRCLSRYMCYSPQTIHYPDGSSYEEKLWRECEKEVPGSFPVWRLE